jgi:hypothetical protein
MATVARWTEAQPEQPNQRPLASPCHRVHAQSTAGRGHRARHDAALTGVLVAYR